MQLYLDSVNLSEIKEALSLPIVYGVTTNPSILRRERHSFKALPRLVEKILSWGARAIHIQVIHSDYDHMLKDTQTILSWAPKGLVIPKIPATRTGLQVAARLAGEGDPVTLTAIFEPEQVFWAKLINVNYAAPYLGRIQKMGRPGHSVIQQMQSYLTASDSAQTNTRLLVASIYSREDVLKLLDLGVGAMTISIKILREIVDHPATLLAEEVFIADARASNTESE